LLVVLASHHGVFPLDLYLRENHDNSRMTRSFVRNAEIDLPTFQ